MELAYSKYMDLISIQSLFILYIILTLKTK